MHTAAANQGYGLWADHKATGSAWNRHGQDLAPHEGAAELHTEHVTRHLAPYAIDVWKQPGPKQFLPTCTCIAWHSSTSFLRVGVSISISFSCFIATASNASVGHSVNQSQVQQLTSDGLARKRSLHGKDMYKQPQHQSSVTVVNFSSSCTASGPQVAQLIAGYSNSQTTPCHITCCNCPFGQACVMHHSTSTFRT